MSWLQDARTYATISDDENEYLKEVARHCPLDTLLSVSFFGPSREPHTWPPLFDGYPLMDSERLKDRTTRHDFIKKYSYAIPDKRCLQLIAQYSPLIEIGAGTGFWANELAKLGADIIAYDPCPTQQATNEFFGENAPSYFDVQLGDHNVLLEESYRTLLLVWPPYSDPMANKCLYRFKGDVVIYVGEPAGGCTGDDAFFTTLEANFTLIDEMAIPAFAGLHDSLYVYRRNRR